MYVVERIDENHAAHLEELESGKTLIKTGLKVKENDVLNDDFTVNKEITQSRKKEVDDLFNSLLEK